MVKIRKGLLITGFILWIIAILISIVPLTLGGIGGFVLGALGFIFLGIPLIIAGFIFVVLGAALSSQGQKLEIARAQSGQYNPALNELNLKLINDQISEEEYNRKKYLILGSVDARATRRLRTLPADGSHRVKPSKLEMLKHDRHFQLLILLYSALAIAVFFAISIFTVPVHLTAIVVHFDISGQNTTSYQGSMNVHSFGFITDHIPAQISGGSAYSLVIIQGVSIKDPSFHVWSVNPSPPKSMPIGSTMTLNVEFSCPYSYSGPLNIYVDGIFS